MQQATAAEARRSEPLRLAHELRQTSDDLTRMAWSYVATGDPRYPAWFREILAIRAGTAPAGGLRRHLLGLRSATPGSGPRRQARLVVHHPGHPGRLPARRSSLLATAQSRRTRWRGPKSRRSRWSRPAARRERADAMLYDGTYLHAKAEIMEPIGQVLTLVDTRTAQETAQAAGRARGLSAAAVTMAVLLLGGMAVFAAVTRRAVLRPVAELDTATARIAAGETDVRARVAGVSELNALGAVQRDGRTRPHPHHGPAGGGTAAESANTGKSVPGHDEPRSAPR
jgi:hypothetical protein